MTLADIQDQMRAIEQSRFCGVCKQRFTAASKVVVMLNGYFHEDCVDMDGNPTPVEQGELFPR